jgi:hypothetical protein
VFQEPAMNCYLRIVCSVLCVVACLFVFRLSGRSRMWTDGLYGQVTPTRTLVVASHDCQVRFWTIPSASLAGFSTYGKFHESIFGCSSRFDTAIFANSSPPAFHVPLVGLVPCAAALAVVPWTGLRFSLRTLMGALTVAAVVLGIVVSSQS